jgi:hypothetical protein
MSASAAIVSALVSRHGSPRIGNLWPCPLCAARSVAGASLVVGHDRDQDPVRCLNGCEPSAIARALVGTVSAPPAAQGSSSATQGSSSATQGSSSATQGSSSATQGSSSNAFTAHVLPCNALLPIADLARTPHALRALPALTITAKIGKRFRCVLPGHHTDPRPNASIWRDPATGLHKYRCWHHDQFGTPEWLRLCDVRAALATEKVRWLGNGVAALWYLRLWYDAGLVEPAPVPLPGLPDRASVELSLTAEGFRLLVGLRALIDGKPTPYSDRLVNPWCGLRGRRGPYRRNDLLRLGVIQKVDERPRGGMRPMPLYRPGDVAP